MACGALGEDAEERRRSEPEAQEGGITLEKLSEHFVRHEFACKCGCGYADPEPALVQGLEELRTLIGDREIYINSACRCERHNRRIGGAQPDPKRKKPGSQHLYGTAADIRVPGMTADQLARAAEQVRVFRTGGIGRYLKKGFVHVDVRGFKARWTM